MPYGIKRGVKAPGEYGVSDIMGLALAGSAGIIAALITDYRQKGEASSLYTINQWVVGAAELFGQALGLGHLHVPLWGIAIGLVAVGAGSIFYFQPITRQGAFAQGFGLLAVIMTAVPADLASALAGPNGGDVLENLPRIEEASRSTPDDGIVPATFRTTSGQPANTGVIQVQDVQAQEKKGARYPVYLEIEFEGGIPGDLNELISQGNLRGRLYNEDTGSTYNLFRRAGGDFTIRGDSVFLQVAVPARSDTAKLWVRIECEGHAIEEHSAQATIGERLDWKIYLSESNTPMFIQRLGKSFWF